MIEVLDPGIYTSIQDSGRFGLYSNGVPKSGYMDHQSAQIANLLLDNKPHMALFECTSLGPTLKFHQPTHICFSGALISPIVNNRTEVPIHNPFKINSGDILSVGYHFIGNYSYLAISGGINTKPFLKSRSMSRSFTPDFRIKKNQFFELNEGKVSYSKGVNVKLDRQILTNELIEVYAGQEFKHLDQPQRKLLFNHEYKVLHSSNRIAYLIEPKIKNNLKPILSNPVLPGTIQLTPSGHLIVLMRDCQTSGGYPRILQLTDDAINIMAQKQPNSKIKFKLKGIPLGSP
ncbi:MAG: biotin-dependent carboxyltransferase family protein [Flavobacteriaceae bacterium]|nr:biotin-dependent carboxyltransferase family protein [Flavobacteriaceae bacterium]